MCGNSTYGSNPFLLQMISYPSFRLFNESSTFKDLQTDKIEFLGRVNDTELIQLYQNASFFIFPSLYEGFGIPPLEAQNCGCPVISSNAASLPDVLSDSVIYFDPLNIQQIKEKIELISSNSNLQIQLREKGFENTKRFSWLKSAKKLNELINSYSKN